jgi:hypothetical protein
MDLYHGNLRAIDAQGRKILDQVDYQKYADCHLWWIDSYRHWWHKLAIEHYKHAWCKAMEAMKVLEDDGYYCWRWYW